MRLHPLSLALATLMSGGAFAQSSAPAPAAAASAASAAEQNLPVVRAKANADKETATGPVDGYRAKRSGTATRTDTPLNEVPQSVSVITADQVRDQASQTLQEVLRYTVGVNAEPYGLDNRGDYFQLRGTDGSVLLDGLRQPITGYWGSVRDEPYAFERIEVLRGPSSLLAGQNGPGGVINMVSKRPTFDTQREVQMQFGTDDHKQIAADLDGLLTTDKRLAYRVVALRKDSGSQVDHADQERTLFAPSLSWRPLDNATVTVYGQYQKDKSLNQNGFFPIEGTLNDAPNGKIPVDTFIGEPDWDTYGGTRKRFGWDIEYQLSDAWTLRQRARRDDVDGGLATAYAAWWLGYVNVDGVTDPDPANNTYLHRVGYKADDTSRIANADLVLEGKLAFSRTKHTLLAGVDHMSHRSTHTDYGVFGEFPMTPLDVYNPVYGSSPLPSFAPEDITASRSRVSNVGVVLQDQVKIDESWVVVAGLRHDKAKTDDEEDSANSKNLGVVYLADGGWSPYVGYSESFQPTAGTDRNGANFKPSRGEQIEAGVKWMPADPRISASAAVYQMKEKNRLSTDPTNPNFSVQVGEATVDGAELDVNAELASWQLLANYAYTRARLTGEFDDNRGEQLSGVRKHAASAWAIYKFGAFGLPGLRTGGGVRYLGSSTDGSGANGVPSVTLLDLLASYDTGPWSLALNINNVADKTYIATCLERGDCWFGTQRKAVASVGYRW
jgi:iron complex outermembrane receptor protein